jgi:hypothetical protein
MEQERIQESLDESSGLVTMRISTILVLLL